MMWALELLQKNKAHTGAYVLLIVLGFGGYSELLLELGELRAEVKYQTETIDRMAEEYGKLTEICN